MPFLALSLCECKQSRILGGLDFRADSRSRGRFPCGAKILRIARERNEPWLI